MKPKNLKDLKKYLLEFKMPVDMVTGIVHTFDETDSLIKDRIKELEKEMNDLFMDGNIITMGETRLFRFLKAHAVIKELKRLLGDE